MDFSALLSGTTFLQPLCPPRDQYFPVKPVVSTLIHVICPLVDYQCTAGSRGEVKNGCPKHRPADVSMYEINVNEIYVFVSEFKFLNTFCDPLVTFSIKKNVKWSNKYFTLS